MTDPHPPLDDDGPSPLECGCVLVLALSALILLAAGAFGG